MVTSGFRDQVFQLQFAGAFRGQTAEHGFAVKHALDPILERLGFDDGFEARDERQIAEMHFHLMRHGGEPGHFQFFVAQTFAEYTPFK